MAATYISEVFYTGPVVSDFIEVVTPGGQDMSAWSVAIYNANGDWLTSMSFGAPAASQAGHDIHVLDQGTAGFPSLNANVAIALIDGSGTAVQYLALYEPPVTANDGPLVGQTPVSAGVTAASGESVESSDGGASYSTQAVPNAGTIPCFGPGALVLGARGWIPVEELREGEPVITRSDGTQPVLWCHARGQSFAAGEDRPIRLAPGALGGSAPFAPLILSPQHRVLIGLPGQCSRLAGREALAPAKAMARLPGVRQMRGRDRITWHHFALARHGVVCVNGLWVESALLGPMLVQGLPRAEQLRLRALFPRSAGDAALNGPAARPVLSARQAEARLLGQAPPRPVHAPAPEASRAP